MINPIFKNKKANLKKLLDFGFIQEAEGYVYSAPIVDGQFRLIVIADSGGGIKTRVIDNDLDDEYILHLTTDAVGPFVGKVRTDYQNVLQKISDTCFETDLFKSKYTPLIIQYIREKYHDELEFLWEKSPNSAIFRRKDNRKWYGVILVLSKRKLGLESDETVDILDLRIKPDEIEGIVDHQKYFPGYHMNKKHWITICLDGSVAPEEIYKRIDDSYTLTKK